MNNNLKKVLITGGAGYIGSHTVVDLYKAGYMPIIVDNLCNSSINNIRGINKLTKNSNKWYNLDCTDYKKMNEVFEKEKDIYSCIHFAAFKSVDESVKNPMKYYDNNIGSLNVLLKCMQNHNVNFLIFSSSCTVYGMPDVLPVDENAPFKKAESPYGETKQKCEQIIESNSINSISLRYFNPIGTHESILIGDCSSDKANNLVPIISEFAFKIRDNLIINGIDYNTFDGTCIRDYIHVEDLSNAHVSALEFLIKKKGKHAFNVGTGKGLSVLEIVNRFERVNNLKLDYQIGERRKGDIEAIYSNCNKIKENFGWEAKKSVDQALISAWKWQNKKINF